MARKRKGTLAGKLTAGGVAARGTTGMPGSKPKKGYQFVQKSGLRAGQSYSVKTGKSGLSERVYETGDTATAQTDTGVDVAAQRRDMASLRRGSTTKAPMTALGTAGARAPRPAVLRRQQQSDIADTTQAAELYRKFLAKQRPSKMKTGLGGKMQRKVKVGRSGGVQAP